MDNYYCSYCNLRYRFKDLYDQHMLTCDFFHNHLLSLFSMNIVHFQDLLGEKADPPFRSYPKCWNLALFENENKYTNF